MSETNIPDATSGFRALLKKCCRAINIFTDYTYTLESIIQAGQKINMSIANENKSKSSEEKVTIR